MSFAAQQASGQKGSKLVLDLVSNAVVGYSVDKLRRGYNGPAIRVRRDSDQAEQDIGFSGLLHDAAGLATFLGGANGFITTMYDQSFEVSNRFDILQTTAANQPQLVNGLVNGDGITHRLFTDGFPSFAGDLTIAFWARNDLVKSDIDQPLELGNGASNNIKYDFNDGAGVLLFWNGTGANQIPYGSGGDYTDTVWYHHLVSRASTTIEAFLDGASQGTSTTNTAFTAGSRLSIFANRDGALPWDGDLETILIFDKAADAADRAIIEAFNAKK